MAKKILVVDNEEDVRETIKTILKTQNYEIVTAESGKIALSLLNKTAFDLILLDIMMPEMSGWDVLTEILKTKPKYKGKIMFLSVVDISEEKEKLLEKEGVGYMSKPFGAKELIERIKKELGRSR